MTLIGKQSYIDANGIKKTTLHVTTPFQVSSNADDSRSCEGVCAQTIYVGNYSCENLKVGMEIEVYFGAAVQGKFGLLQSVKKIEVLK